MLQQKQKLKTNVTISTKVIQGLRFLSSSIEELLPLIIREILENPVFDLEKIQNHDSIKHTLSYHDLRILPYSQKNNIQSLWETLPEKTSFLSRLKQQAFYCICNVSDTNIVEHILGNLNKYGYLGCSLEEIAILSETEISQVRSVLSLAQQIWPPGIAALNIKEYVLSQLKSRSGDKEAYRIILEYFDNNLQCDLNLLSKKLRLSISLIKQTVQRALSRVTFYATDTTESCSHYALSPDVIAHYTNKKWKIIVNESLLPPLYFNACYLRTHDKITEKFMQTYLIKAKSLMENIEKRKKTLTDIFSYIIATQSDFLNSTSKQPKYLTVKEISRHLSLHVSTVFRALKNKTILCNGSFIAVKQLISSYSTENTTTLSSSHSIKQIIKQLISEENVQEPLSDQQIYLHLTQVKNIVCSRRTVTKYRIALGIPSTFKRKNLLYVK